MADQAKKLLLETLNYSSVKDDNSLRIEERHGWMTSLARPDLQQSLGQLIRKDGRFKNPWTNFSSGGNPRASALSSLTALQKEIQAHQEQEG